MNSKTNFFNALKTVYFLKSLNNFVSSLRDSSESYENKITQLSQNVYKIFKNENEKNKKKKYPDCKIIEVVKKKLCTKEKTKWSLKLIIDQFILELESIIITYNYIS